MGSKLNNSREKLQILESLTKTNPPKMATISKLMQIFASQANAVPTAQEPPQNIP